MSFELPRKRQEIVHVIHHVGRFLLGAYMIYMGAIKAMDPVDFLKLLREYQFLSMAAEHGRRTLAMVGNLLRLIPFTQSRRAWHRADRIAYVSCLFRRHPASLTGIAGRALIALLRGQIRLRLRSGGGVCLRQTHGKCRMVPALNLAAALPPYFKQNASLILNPLTRRSPIPARIA
jgi:hypothetical protein